MDGQLLEVKNLKVSFKVGNPETGAAKRKRN